MILPSPTAPDGSVTTLDRYHPSTFGPSDAVLCRNVAPLVGLAFGLLRRDVPCRVLGREIGKGLTQLIDKMKASDLDELRESVQRWKAKELERAARRHTSPEYVEDKANCLLWAIDSVNSIPDLMAKLDRLFNGASDVLTLATVHKSKGLEWLRVFILDRHLMPSKYATQPWQQTQERNIQYVAVTRAKVDLVYIRSDRWRNEV